MKSQFLIWAEQNGWHIAYEGFGRTLSPDVARRYPHFPRAYADFIDGLAQCVAPDETAWFLTADNFEPKPEDQFRWNECERISLEAADGDEDIIQEVTAFWDNHLPILMNVASGYEYYAYRMDDGKIVMGYEPEFEESAEVVAGSFEDFLNKIINGNI